MYYGAWCAHSSDSGLIFCLLHTQVSSVIALGIDSARGRASGYVNLLVLPVHVARVGAVSRVRARSPRNGGEFRCDVEKEKCCFGDAGGVK